MNDNFTKAEFLEIRQKLANKFKGHNNSEKLIAKINSYDNIEELGEFEEFLHWEALVMAFNSSK